jgi:predicted amidohydrolase YtcJ
LTSLEQLLAKVEARVAEAKPGAWVTGRGWIETFWSPPVFPTRWDLEIVARVLYSIVKEQPRTGSW